MIHYRENIYSLDNYERYITDSSLFENTGDGIIYTGIVPLITVVEPVVSKCADYTWRWIQEDCL